MIHKGYVPFKSSKFHIPCTFLYPADWKVEETALSEEGNEHKQIFITGPYDQAGRWSASLTVWALLAPNQTEQEATALFLSSCQSDASYQKLGQASGIVAAGPATEVEIVHSLPLPVDGGKSEPSLLRERHIFLKRKDYLYELIYAAAPEDYATWFDTFRILVWTFCFIEEPIDTAFHPLVKGTMDNASKTE